MLWDTLLDGMGPGGRLAGSHREENEGNLLSPLGFPRKTLCGHLGAVWEVKEVPGTEGCVLASSSADGSIALWSVSSPATWSVRNHRLFPKTFKEMVIAVLLVHSRGQEAGEGSHGGAIGSEAEGPSGLTCTALGSLNDLCLYHIIGSLAGMEISKRRGATPPLMSRTMGLNTQLL